MKYTEALKLFVAEGNRLEWTTKPFTIGEKAYATTTFMVAFLDKTLTEGISELREDKKETVLRIIPKERNINFIFPVSRIEQIINDLPMVDEYAEKDCVDCDGSGEVEFEYNSIEGKTYEIGSECPICRGSGVIVRKTGGKVKDMNGFIQIDKQCFLLERFKVVLEAAKLLEVENIELVLLATKRNVSVFEIGKMTVLIMPVNMESDEETPKIVDVIELK